MLKVADKIKSDSKKYPCEFQILQASSGTIPGFPRFSRELRTLG